MSDSKKQGILISALSVAVAILLLGYSAYGWMAMSKEVKATGMNLNVVAPNNLEISLTGNVDDYHQTVDVELKDIVAAQTAGDAKVFDPDNDEFYLMPSSSYEGLSAWYTTQALYGTGAALCNEDEFIPGHRVQFYSGTDAFEGHYIDVKLWLRTLSTTGVEVVLLKDKTTVTSLDSASIVNVVRVAFLNDNATAISYTGNAGYDALVFEQPAVVGSTTVVTDNGGVSKYVTSKYMTFTGNASDQTVCTIAAAELGGEEAVYHPVCITARIWIEGQDTDCVPVIGAKSFSVQLGFSVKD